MLQVSCAPLRPIITYLEHAAVHERRPQGGEKEEKESGSFVFSLRDIFFVIRLSCLAPLEKRIEVSAF